MQNNTFTVKASKEFPVPVEKLYAAWTQPEQLKQWWKPMNNSLTDVTNDLREGGTVRYVFQEAGLQITGNYSEVKENERLVYSWNWEFANDTLKNASYTLTIDFKSTGSGSSIQVSQDNLTDEEGTQAHQEGWEKGLNDLAAFLGHSANGSSTDDAETTGEKSSAGYNEAPEQAKVAGG